MKDSRPFALVILDGVGYRTSNGSDNSYNAIEYAKMPYFKSWFKEYPHAILTASGQAVGLPQGFASNSEVGHLTIGAGRIMKQTAALINDALDDKSFFSHKTIVAALNKLKNSGKKLHIFGLLSDAGIHSRLKHLDAFIDAAHQQGITNIVIHPFLDGRDSAPQSASTYLTHLSNKLATLRCGTIGSIHGRFYAMDRDKKWDRTEKSYHVLTNHDQVLLHSWRQALDYYYNNHITDEFIPPTKLAPNASISEGDGVIFFNFRPDRARQLTAAFIDPQFKQFKTKPISLSCFITPTQYDANLATDALFPYQAVVNTLKEVLAAHEKTIFSIAETEKYAHVTYFFDGGKEETLKGETRVLIPSLGSESYSSHPEMSCREITAAVISSLKNSPRDFYLINYANADMVGHSGSMGATIKALEYVDEQLGKLYDHVVVAMNGTLFITADHGKAEDMFDPITKQPRTAHTNNPVPFIMVRQDMKNKPISLPLSQLSNVAPFILHTMGIPIPAEMR